MYQRIEIVTTHATKDHNGNTHYEKSYSYEDGWKKDKEDSKEFSRTSERDSNPDIDWPFVSKITNAKQIKMGRIDLNTEFALEKLGHKIEEKLSSRD